MGKKEVEVKFIGMQENTKNRKSVPQFNVLKKGHRLYKSTVTMSTLRKNGLKVPKFKIEGKT